MSGVLETATFFLNSEKPKNGFFFVSAVTSRVDPDSR